MKYKVSSLNCEEWSHHRFFVFFILNASIDSIFFQLVSCVRLNAMHTVFSLWNSENQLRQASSEAIQLCAEEAEFRPTIRYNDDVFHHER